MYLSHINDENSYLTTLESFSTSPHKYVRVKRIMATRKLFDATARYLTTTHDDSDDETKKMMKSMLMKQHHTQQQQQQSVRANSKIKLEINKRFLVSTIANCAQANRYRDANSLYRAKEKEDTMMKTPTTCKCGRKKQQHLTMMKTPGTKKRTRSEDQEEETNEKRRRAGGGGASTSSSSSSSSDENDDENENDDIEDKIRKLLLLSKTKRGRGLIGARMDDVVKEDFIENDARGSTRKKKSTKKKKEKRRKKEKKREKKEKKERSKSSKTREMGN